MTACVRSVQLPKQPAFTLMIWRKEKELFNPQSKQRAFDSLRSVLKVELVCLEHGQGVKKRGHICRIGIIAGESSS